MTGRRATLLRLVALLVVGCSVVALRGWQLRADPGVSYLEDDGRAQWIVLDRPFRLTATRNLRTGATFRHRFETSAQVSEATLSVRAMRRFRAYFDGQPVGASSEAAEDWKRAADLPLPSPVPPGRHEIAIVVENWRGPPALAVHSEALGLSSSAAWEASPGGGFWMPARPADEVRRPSISARLPSTRAALAAVAPWLLPLVALAFCAAYLRPRARPPLSAAAAWALAPGHLRWLLMGLWLALGIHNLPRIGSAIGFDAGFHLEYVRWIVERRSLPLATDGWQMFQAPLYYLLSAGLLEVSSSSLDPDRMAKALRVVPLVCGLLQIELIFRISRLVFPEKQALQRVAMLVGSLMPMHVYLSQVVGNEPLAALFTSALVLCTLRSLEARVGLPPWRDPLLAGLAWGAALLTKSSAALLAPALAFALVAQGARSGAPVRHWLPRVALVPGAAFAVSGWYYLRNLVVLGQPFVGGWDPLRGIDWWQDPGYRTFSQLVPTGESLLRPVYAGAAGWWDAIHSTMWLDGFLSGRADPATLPPWCFTAMVAGAILGLVPAALIAMGAWRTLVSARAQPRLALLFAVFCVVAYLAAVLDLYVRLPIYSTAKATYMLGLLPCFGLLAAAGFEALHRSRLASACVAALLVGWAGAGYVAYWAG